MRRRTDGETLIHYDLGVSPLKMKQADRRGKCGEIGVATGYVAFVTCAGCREYADADLQEMRDAQRLEQASHPAKN